jgi:uridine kinase
MDWDLIYKMFEDLSMGKDVVIPQYDFVTSSRIEPGTIVKCAPLILIEGIFCLFDK